MPTAGQSLALTSWPSPSKSVAVVARDTGVDYLPAFMQGVADDRKLMQADGLHPTREAQYMLLDNVWPSIKAMLGSGDG